MEIKIILAVIESWQTTYFSFIDLVGLFDSFDYLFISSWYWIQYFSRNLGNNSTHGIFLVLCFLVSSFTKFNASWWHFKNRMKITFLFYLEWWISNKKKKYAIYLDFQAILVYSNFWMMNQLVSPQEEHLKVLGKLYINYMK
jgi:hypothetical protein